MLDNRQQALPAGTMVGSFEIRRVIGTGGFGVTYMGYDTTLERKVAIKEYCPHGFAVRSPGTTELHPSGPEQEETFVYGLSRFLDEARTLARFHHPSIVHVHRFLEANGTGYLVMDFEEGKTLWQVLRKRGALDERALLDLLVPVLEGLEVVHEQNFLHRDIKPANVFVRDKGTPVLLDFGAARQALEQQGKALTVLLTPGYAPLEQYSSDNQQGPWSDLYALGATAYHCMTGQAPLSATDRIARLHSGQTDPVSAELAEQASRYGELVRETVAWMLEPVAGDRPQNTSELLAALHPGGPPGPRFDEAPTVMAPERFAPDPALTQALERTLEQHAGRVAQRVVRPAVTRATSFDELVDHLAGFVLDPQRQQRFRTEAATLRGSAPTGSDPGTGSRDDTAERPPTTGSGVSERAIDHAKKHLAEIVGPIASVLVDAAAEQATSRDEFYALLAEELDDPSERRDFLSRLK